MRTISALLVAALITGCSSAGNLGPEDETMDPATYKTTLGEKCADATPPSYTCPKGSGGDHPDVRIICDSDGAPSDLLVEGSTNQKEVRGCAGKKVRWEYSNNCGAKHKKSKFRIEFSGNPHEGRPWPRSRGSLFSGQQRYRMTTRALKSTEPALTCFAYKIVVPGKGELDPVFWIRR